ncbi:MAG TPA: aminodeoxychorismate synthase component I [Rhizomicrobium sp.]|nr:aminodeoxychorismate synthase component I [Rhizomicrobium sp.]
MDAIPAPPVIVLENPHAGGRELLLFERPKEIIGVTRPEEIQTAFDRLERAREAGFHLAGWFSHELGYLLEPRLASLLCGEARETMPLLWFGMFDAPWEVSRAALCARGRAYAGPLRNDWSAEDYRIRFARIQRYIRSGDIYQANLTFRATFAFAGDPFALWLALRDSSAVRHGGYIDTGDQQIVSLSPELHFSVSADGRMECRPMKGTAPRGSDPYTDEARRRALAASPKDRAENLMIVDLMRNDMARIAQIGSVRVPELFRVETYPSLHTMVSVVEAQLRRGVRIWDLAKAIFPCGSVTGAPKIRAMEIIRELETGPRGIYCGSIGHFAPDGSASFNVAIRTIALKNGEGVLGIGGGVVQDSSANGEYAECLLKAQFFESNRKPLRLIETLRYSGSFLDAERHLARMANSARVFSLPFDKRAAREALAAAVAGRDGNLRVRLVLGENGAFAATAEPLAPGPVSWKFAISPERVDSLDLLLRHKTDRRELFEEESARLACRGIDEVLFLNERGELTEGSRTNLFIRRNGKLATPSLSCGLLSGILRGKLLESGRCEEEILYLRDLETAEGVFLGNSLRGMIPAVMDG